MNESGDNIPWVEANQAFLVAELAWLKLVLERPAQPVVRPRTALTPPPAIDQLAQYFGLSEFERDVLLLCAGVEMDSKLAAQCAEANGHPQREFATFGLAMAVLPQPHWSALTPTRPLRKFRLLEVETTHGLVSAPLRIDERVLHYLAGVNVLDIRLQSLVPANPPSDWITDEHRAVAEQVLQTLGTPRGDSPVIQICGDDPQGQEDVAALAAQGIGRQLFALRSGEFPGSGAELDQFMVLWQRERFFVAGALFVQVEAEGLTPGVRQLAERLPGPLFLASREPLRVNRACRRFDVNKPPLIIQKELWRKALGAKAEQFNGTVEALAGQFRLSAKTVFATAALATSGAAPLGPEQLWGACRSLSRPRLGELAQRIVSTAGWDDLILPDLQKQTLRQIASQVQHRMKVHETWGFSSMGGRGLGVSALFSGESGTGKTLATEVLARELGLDLYRIDLSAAVSKYIGETEKNLKQVFDAAEAGGVLLLFDEADALFGKRSDVKDSHDRYANIEVSYLLQRMEAYQGLAILTTNLKSSMDRAFQRRIRFHVTFPFPDLVHREAIWSRVFPPKTPVQGLDHARLARLNVAGGNIRNIALNAAFLAADEGEGQAVEMKHLVRAARFEVEKIERPLSEAEIRGWI